MAIKSHGIELRIFVPTRIPWTAWRWFTWDGYQNDTSGGPRALSPRLKVVLISWSRRAALGVTKYNAMEVLWWPNADQLKWSKGTRCVQHRMVDNDCQVWSVGASLWTYFAFCFKWLGTRTGAGVCWLLRENTTKKASEIQKLDLVRKSKVRCCQQQLQLARKVSPVFFANFF